MTDGGSKRDSRWVDLVRDFMAESIDQPCVLVGNSVGSLVALTVRLSGK